MLLVAMLPAAVDGATTPRSGTQRIAPRAPDGVYLVTLAAKPAVAYTGDIAGYPATKPAKGAKINPNAPKVAKYVAKERADHDKLLTAAGAKPAKKLYSYTYAANGFAAVLTRAQATKLLNMRGVMSVAPDQLHKKTADDSGTFLGLNDPDGGLRADLGLTGENVIIGVVDTGIWPEHPSFSDQSDLKDRHGRSAVRRRVYGPPPASWHGICQTGEKWNANDCNNKLIGARYFLEGFGVHGIIDADFISARDKDGHGTHTTSTSGGNANVQASIFGISRGTISGIAPRARVAMYKALWNDEGGYSSDLAAAIDAAVGDGVDVINYSIGSDQPAFDGPDDIAFLFANDAGVFASVSAGNSGPGSETIGSPAAAPWVMTVGASTLDRSFTGSVRLGNNVVYKGDSITKSLSSKRVVDGAAAGSELCILGELNKDLVEGKIVLCLRGGNGRVDKSVAVKAAGGAGMILYNQADAMVLMTDNFLVPTVMVNHTTGLAIKAYIAANRRNARAALTTGTASPSQGSRMAEFSSRGPNTAAPDILKPDITAPGVQILAGNSPVPFLGAKGQLFQSIAGTSMSAPHVTGLAALLVQAHPTWTPDQIKSALMLSARQNVVKEDGVTPADPFDMGAGHVNANSAVSPGVTMNATFDDYLDFYFGTYFDGSPFDRANLNIASIAISDLAGSQTVPRTFISVDPASTTWTWSKEGLAGVDVSISTGPTLTLAAAATATWQATFTNVTAPADTWVFGAIVWTAGDGRTARLPVALQPVKLGAPPVVAETVTTDPATIDWTVGVGYTGTLSASGYGLAADGALPGQTVAQDPDKDPTTDPTGVGVANFDVVIADGTRYFAAGTFGATTSPPASDLDVFILYDFSGDGLYTFDELVAVSADSDSEEIAEIVDPPSGNYRVVVHGYSAPSGTTTFTYHSWVVNQATGDTGTLETHAGTGDPFAVTLGQVVPIHATVSAPTVGVQYRGLVDYVDGASAVLGSTVLIVDR
jgi:subtilisin family serine protease